MFGLPLAANVASSVQAPKKDRALYARLFDRMNPGGADMSDEDKSALFRQGLLGLAAGMASTSGQGTAGAIGNGLQSGLLAMSQGRESLTDSAYKKAMMERSLGDPAGLREFEAMTAGMSPEEKEKARRINLGIEGRASSAGMGFDWQPDANGVLRPTRTDPRTGQMEQLLAEENRWVPLGGSGGAPGGLLGPQAAAAPGAPMGGLLGPQGAPVSLQTEGGPMAGQRFGNVAIGDDIPPAVRAQILADEARGQQPHQWLNIPNQPMAGSAPAPVIPAGLGRGRTKEQEAAAVAAATQGVELSALPVRLGMETDAAVDRTTRVADAENTAKRAAEAPKRIASYRTALAAAGNVEESIEKSKQLAGALSTGWIGARSRGTEGTPAYNLAAEIETIRANLGFDRLQQMRDNSPTGGALGQVAVQELVALQSTVANLDPNQSEKQLLANLARVQNHYSKWKAAVQQSLEEESMRQPAPSEAGPAPSSGNRLRFNPATGDLE